MDQFSEYVYTSNLQSGFKPDHSTTWCTTTYMLINIYVKAPSFTDAYLLPVKHLTKCIMEHCLHY